MRNGLRKSSIQEVFDHMPSTIVTSRAYSPILVADDPNEVSDEDKDNDEVCPTRMSKKLSLKGQP